MKKIVIEMLVYIVGKLRNLFMRLVSILPTNNNLAIFTSYYGKYYNDNPRAISDKLATINSNVRICWLMENPEQYSDERHSNISFVKNDSIRALYLQARAKIWVDNCRKRRWIYKRKGQYYIQTWHGNLGLKYCEKDSESTLPKRYLKDAKHDGRISDFMISNSRWTDELYRRAFWFNGKILRYGTPRDDVLFEMTDNKICSIKAKLNINNNENILLYAPTFRENRDTSVYNIDYERLISSLEKTTNEKWKILIRFHPNLKDQCDNLNIRGVINVTDYPDLYELIGICSIFITDYSSSMFEAAIINKPVILYQFDYKQFMSERKLYFNDETLPFLTVHDNDELNSIIESKRYLEDCDFKEFCFKHEVKEDGNASEKVAQFMLRLMK